MSADATDLMPVIKISKQMACGNVMIVNCDKIELVAINYCKMHVIPSAEFLVYISKVQIRAQGTLNNKVMLFGKSQKEAWRVFRSLQYYFLNSQPNNSFVSENTSNISDDVWDPLDLF